jgi:hypothetical protein
MKTLKPRVLNLEMPKVSGKFHYPFSCGWNKSWTNRVKILRHYDNTYQDFNCNDFTYNINK